jgi:hypothetical protein
VWRAGCITHQAIDVAIKVLNVLLVPILGQFVVDYVGRTAIDDIECQYHRVGALSGFGVASKEVAELFEDIKTVS